MQAYSMKEPKEWSDPIVKTLIARKLINSDRKIEQHLKEKAFNEETSSRNSSVVPNRRPCHTRAATSFFTTHTDGFKT